MSLITNVDRWKESAFAALVTIAACVLTALLVTLVNDCAINASTWHYSIHAPNLVAVSQSNRGVRYVVDSNSDTCYVMYTNVMGTSFAPVGCGAIGVDPYSVPRTGQ